MELGNDLGCYLSLSRAFKLAFPSYPRVGKTREMPCTDMHIPPPTEPKQWYRGTGRQTRVWGWRDEIRTEKRVKKEVKSSEESLTQWKRCNCRFSLSFVRMMDIENSSQTYSFIFSKRYCTFTDFWTPTELQQSNKLYLANSTFSPLYCMLGLHLCSVNILYPYFTFGA